MDKSAGITRRLGAVLVALGVVGALGLGTARAQEDAHALFQRGQASYSQGDYDGAIRLWEEAYALDPRPLLQFNLSQALERLGRLEAAVEALQTYLDHADPADASQPAARARQAQLRERIANTSLLLVGGVEGATVLLDGQDRGRLPHPDPLRVSPGTHDVVVRAAGRADFSSRVVVPAGQSLELQVVLGDAVSAEGPSSQASFPTVPVVLWAVGGAALVGGAVLGSVALDQAQGAPSSSSPEADGARTLALASDVTMGAGLACAAAGLVVFLVGSGSGEPVGTAGLGVHPFGGPGGAGLRAEGRF